MKSQNAIFFYRAFLSSLYKFRITFLFRGQNAGNVHVTNQNIEIYIYKSKVTLLMLILCFRIYIETSHMLARSETESTTVFSIQFGVLLTLCISLHPLRGAFIGINIIFSFN